MNTALPDFIQQLWERGQVTVAGRIQPPTEAQEQAALAMLQHYYAEDALHLPYRAPAFAPEAALWAANYLYLATQLALLRHVEEETVKASLSAFAGPTTPENTYSIDLSFRHLPTLLQLARGLSPDDILVQCLQQALQQWPFSSVGTSLISEPDHRPILQHPSLRSAYIDRIIRHQDKSRAADPALAPLLQEALGNYAATLWPDFQRTIH